MIAITVVRKQLNLNTKVENKRHENTNKKRRSADFLMTKTPVKFYFDVLEGKMKGKDSKVICVEKVITLKNVKIPQGDNPKEVYLSSTIFKS